MIAGLCHAFGRLGIRQFIRMEVTVSFDVFPKILDNVGFRGEVAEWLMAADCKSALLRVRWFESSPLHQEIAVEKQQVK